MLMLELDLRGRPAIVVGGGAVAERKVGALLLAAMRVTIVAPALSPGLADLVQSGSVAHVDRTYAADDVSGAALVVAATGIVRVDAAVAADVIAAGGLVCVASDGELGNVHFVAQVERGPVKIGVSTGGGSPALARRVRDAVAGAVGPEYGMLAELLAEVRQAVRGRPDLTQADRAALYAELMDGPLLGLLARGEVAQARELVTNTMRKT